METLTKIEEDKDELNHNQHPFQCIKVKTRKETKNTNTTEVIKPKNQRNQKKQ